MKIRLLSDLHLELQDKPVQFSNFANVCILAGDIGNPFEKKYNKLLRLLSLVHDKVFVITGNHEYYNKESMLTVESKIQELCESHDNIHYLQKSSYIYQGVRFLGCTLWTQGEDSLAKYMNDFTQIPNFTCEKYNELFLDHSTWLSRELSLTGDFSTTCVITHHLPKTQLISPQYKDNPLNCFYASNVDITGANICCYGHTHEANQITIDGVRFYCNPGGYENETSNWNPNMVINIK